jgi:competence protein ComEA
MRKPQPPNPDWASGPAKYAAAIVMGIAAIVGMTISYFGNSRTVPRFAETPAVVTLNEAADSEAAPASASAESPAETPAGEPSLAVNLNTATAQQLELLPGIGPALAQRIIEERGRRGQFKSVDDLDKVKGIGPRTLAKLRPLVRVDEPAPQQPGPQPAGPPPSAPPQP